MYKHNVQFWEDNFLSKVHGFVSMIDCNFDDIHFKYIEVASKTGQIKEQSV